MTSIIEQYAALLVRFGSTTHPSVLTFISQNSGVPGFLAQVEEVNQVFEFQRGRPAQERTAISELVHAFLIIHNSRVL